jgi:hypothetical protein
MQNAYKSKYSHKYHKKIIDIVRPKVAHMLKSFREPPYKIKGKPPIGLQKFVDMNFSHTNTENYSILINVPVKNLRTIDPDSKDFRFQRHIKVENSIKHINDDLTGEPAGFSFDYCGIIEGTLCYDPDEKEWYILVEIGQHRGTMAFLVGGEDIEIPTKVFIPKHDITPDELLLKEAIRHFVDATKRTGQNQVDKMSSAYFSESESAKKLISFYNECGVSVGHILPYEKKCDSWGEIEKCISAYGENVMKLCLSTIARYSNENQINAKAVMSLAHLYVSFKDRVDAFEKLNKLEFIETVVKYVFVDRQPKPLKMGNITQHSGNYKGIELMVASWIRYINEMFEWRDYKKDNKADSWMSRRSPEWKEFLEKNVDEIFHESMNQRIKID